MRDGNSNRERRGHARRSVIWHGELAVGEYVFDCSLLNISLTGARIRLDLPLKRGAEVFLTLHKFGEVPAKVSWHRGDRLGLRFQLEPEDLRRRLGKTEAARLGLDRSP